MAATRDPSQKITFVYTNLYSVYKKGKTAAQEADVSAFPGTPGLTRVIKADDLHRVAGQSNARAGTGPQVEPQVAPQVKEYSPLALLGKRVIKPGVVRDAEDQRFLKTTRAQVHAESTLQGLRENLGTLQGLQKKIKFFLGELEELSVQARRPAFDLDDEE